MTDKEVSRLNRKELLEFLLDAQTENEALRKERSDLSKRVKQLEEDLAKARTSVSDIDRQAALLLQEARFAADNVVSSQKEHQAVQEQRMQEWERRLKERDGRLSDQEEAARKLLAAVETEVSRMRQDASNSAEEVRRTAAEHAAETLRNAEESAAQILKKAQEKATAIEAKAASDAETILRHAKEDSDCFWQDVTERLSMLLAGRSGGESEDGK